MFPSPLVGRGATIELSESDVAKAYVRADF